MLEELLRQIGFERHQAGAKISFGPLVVEVPHRDSLLMIPIQDTETNLRLAREKGIKPLTLEEIFQQVSNDDLRNTVLFDSSPYAAFPGNHWRIVGRDDERRVATLQYCGAFGNNDYKQIPPVEVPFDLPLFTGVSIEQFKLNGLPATLQETAEAYEGLRTEENPELPINYKWLGETILWSDAEGVLRPSAEHPAFATR